MQNCRNSLKRVNLGVLKFSNLADGQLHFTRGTLRLTEDRLQILNC